MQGEAQHVRRRLQQVRGDPDREQLHRPVAQQQVPLPVDDHRGAGFMCGEQQLQRVPHGPKLRCIEAGFPVLRCVASSDEQVVALPQRYVEVLGQPHHNVRARPRSAALGPSPRTTVTRGDVRVGGEPQLADVTATAPLP